MIFDHLFCGFPAMMIGEPLAHRRRQLIRRGYTSMEA